MPSISDIVKANQPDLASYEELCKYSFNSVDTSINGDPDKWFHTHPELFEQLTVQGRQSALTSTR